MSCAACHLPDKHFADERATGLDTLDRNTPSLFDLANRRWYGWAGQSDSLWSQSIRPLLAPAEMNTTAEEISRYIARTPDLRGDYQAVTGSAPELHTAAVVLANIGKILAAYQETLVSPRTPFDRFRDALTDGENEGDPGFSLSARRGLKLFIGRGRCVLCHSGPSFTNGEFADTGIPYFTATGVDGGRYQGIKQLLANSYNLLGEHSDDNSEDAGIATRHIELQHRNWGEFKVPGLRGLAVTAPYMHNGVFSELDEIVDYYNDGGGDDPNQSPLIQPLNLTDDEKFALVEFLYSLSGSEIRMAVPKLPEYEIMEDF
ncbi:MAG: cytochrome c peroxidase, partial [Pseudomonadota bacterium]